MSACAPLTVYTRCTVCVSGVLALPACAPGVLSSCASRRVTSATSLFVPRTITALLRTSGTILSVALSSFTSTSVRVTPTVLPCASFWGVSL